MKTASPAFSEQLISSFEQLVEGLAEKSYGILPSFLPAPEAKTLMTLLAQHRLNGKMRKAGIGNMNEFQVNREVRGDLIKWIDPESAAPEVQSFLGNMVMLMDYLNRTCYLGLKDFEAHFAVYPPGTFYRRHLDQFKNSSHRRITFILYLNEDWQPEFGGQLRIYPDGQPSDIFPEAGKLVVFRSDVLEHEVIETKRERCSITGWFLDRPHDLPVII